MKYVTIEQWIEQGESGISHAQVITCEKYSFNIKSEVMDLKELVEYYDARGPEDVFEYKINDNKLLISDIGASRAKHPKTLELPKTPYYLKALDNTIYHLFDKLMEDNAYLVAPEGLEDIDNIENNIIEFIPKYSASTMSVYIPIPVNLYWKSIKLIYAEGDNIKSNDFYFRIPKPVEDKYNYETVGRFILSNVEYVIKHYNNENSLYVYDPSKVRLFESLINRRAYLSAQLKNYINAISLVKRLRCREMITVEYKHSNNTKNMSVFNSNVTFESTADNVTKSDVMDILEDISNSFRPMLERDASNKEITEHILYFTKDNLEYSVYLLLADIYIKTNGYKDIASVFNVCNDAIEKYSKQKARVDALIYAFRINYFSFNTTYLSDKYTFAGGGIPAKTKFRRTLESDF